VDRSGRLLHELGTEETVIRGVDHKLSQSPSILDVAYVGNLATPASSFVSMVREHAANTASPFERQDYASLDTGFFSLRPTQPLAEHQATPRSGSNEADLKLTQNHATGSQHYLSAKVTPTHPSIVEKDRIPVAYSHGFDQFDHQQELKEFNVQRIDEQTFGNKNSKRSLLEPDKFIKITEAVYGNAVGQENAIIRPSGSKVSLKQVEDVAPSSSANEDGASATNTNVAPNSSTAIQSSIMGTQKQDSQQQANSVLMDVSVGVSQSSQPAGIIKVS